MRRARKWFGRHALEAALLDKDDNDADGDDLKMRVLVMMMTIKTMPLSGLTTFLWTRGF